MRFKLDPLDILLLKPNEIFRLLVVLSVLQLFCTQAIEAKQRVVLRTLSLASGEMPELYVAMADKKEPHALLAWPKRQPAEPLVVLHDGTLSLFQMMPDEMFFDLADKEHLFVIVSLNSFFVMPARK